MKKRSIISTTVATGCFAAQIATAGSGYIFTETEVPHRDRTVPLHIYYPTAADGGGEALGKNAVFKGVEVFPNAPAANGNHPVVLLSHGSGGNGKNLAWIAAHLAEKGMIVFAPNHPGTTSNDSYPSQTAKIWERPQDLVSILDRIEAGDFDMLNPDPSRIGVMGFSLGGYSALSLVGAEVRQQRYVDYCTRNEGLNDCGWFARADFDFATIDTQRYEASRRDPRIDVSIAIDPAMSAAYDEEALRGIASPLHLINLGNPDSLWEGIDASEIAQKVPGASYTTIADATHFSFLAECTRSGWVIIKAAGEDPICSDNPERPRADIHKELQAEITATFADAFAMAE